MSVPPTCHETCHVYHVLCFKSLFRLQRYFLPSNFDINVPTQTSELRLKYLDTDESLQSPLLEVKSKLTNHRDSKLSPVRYMRHRHDHESHTLIPLTLFQAVILTSDPKIVMLFLTKGPTSKQFMDTDRKNSLLGLACQLGVAEVVNSFLNAGAIIGLYPGQHSILLIAIESWGSTRKTDARATDPEAQTIVMLINAVATPYEPCLLHNAINNGHLTVVAMTVPIFSRHSFYRRPSRYSGSHPCREQCRLTW